MQIEIVLPTETEAQIRRSAHRLVDQIEICRTSLILTFERTGPLAFNAVQAGGFDLPPVISVDVSRSISQRFCEQHSRAGFDPEGLTAPQIAQYRAWLESDGEAGAAMALLRAQFRDLEPGSHITVIDDTGQTGGTLGVTGAAIITASIAPIRRPDFRSIHSQIASLAHRIGPAADSQQADVIPVQLDYVSPDPDWLGDIIVTSFKPILFSVLPPEELKAAFEFLAHIATGSIRRQGKPRQLLTRDQMAILGARIAEQRMWEVSVSAAHHLAEMPIRNPAEVLEQKFGRQALISLSDQIGQRVYEVGLFGE